MASVVDMSAISVEDAGYQESETIENPPALFKTYFDDPTSSDLTVKLRDRSLHLHRIVLCRASTYFSDLLAGGFKVKSLWPLLHTWY